MDDRDEQPSDPLFPDPIGDDVRPMSYVGAVGWWLGLTFLLLFLFGVLHSIRPSTPPDLVTKFGCQVIAVLLVLFFILRFHAPNRGIADFLGVRGTHFLFVPIAALLGASVQIPATALYEIILRRFPVNDGREQDLVDELSRGMPTLILFTVILALLGPLIEEIFFRGALFRPLRRRYSPGSVIVMTSVLFSLSHLEPQILLPIGLVGLSLGFMRYMSGSLVPGVVMHGVFNGMTLMSMNDRASGAEASATPEAIPLDIVLAGSALTLALLGLTYLLGQKSKLALIARLRDNT